MIGIFVVGIIISLDIVRSELIKNTTENTLTLGANISDNLDRRIDSTITNLSTFVLNPQVLELIKESNDEFDQIENISEYMNATESEWLSYDDDKKENPMFDEMVNNPLSQKLETFRHVIKTSSNIDMFPEIFIVNKYGATIAENSRTSNWDQSNELKFKKSKIHGSNIDDIYYDASAGIWALSVALAIYDDDEFAGIINAIYAIQDIHQLILDAKNEVNYEGMEVNVFTSDRRYIFSDGINAKTPGDKIDEYFMDFKDSFVTEGSSSIVDVHGINKLVVYTTSDGFRNFPGLGWIVAISIPEQDFLEPINQIQDVLVVLLLISIGVSILMSVIMVRSIVIPILKIKNASVELSGGNFAVKTAITSPDEIGALSASFDEMSKKLQESQIAINLREELIRQKDDILLKFSDSSSVQCCVGVIDIIQSTKTTASLTDTEINDFYGIFINAVNKTIKKFNGVTVKNLGDGLLFYFPKSNDSNVENNDDTKNQNAKLHNVIQCCLDICKKNNEINKKMDEKGLPAVNFRISITYGSVSIAKVSTSIVEDIFGSTVNQCAKINHYAKPNGVVIGNSMYEKVKCFSQYVFEKIDGQSVGNEDIYSVDMEHGYKNHN